MCNWSAKSVSENLKLKAGRGTGCQGSIEFYSKIQGLRSMRLSRISNYVGMMSDSVEICQRLSGSSEEMKYHDMK